MNNLVIVKKIHKVEYIDKHPKVLHIRNSRMYVSTFLVLKKSTTNNQFEVKRDVSTFFKNKTNEIK